MEHLTGGNTAGRVDGRDLASSYASSCHLGTDAQRRTSLAAPFVGTESVSSPPRRRLYGTEHIYSAGLEVDQDAVPDVMAALLHRPCAVVRVRPVTRPELLSQREMEAGIEPASADAPTSVYKLRSRLEIRPDGWFATDLPPG